MAEQRTVNAMVVGPTPTLAAPPWQPHTTEARYPNPSTVRI